MVSRGRGAGDVVTVAIPVPADLSAPTLVPAAGSRRVRGAEGEKCPAERPSPLFVSLRVRGDRERQDQGGEVAPARAVGCPAVGGGSAVVSTHQAMPLAAGAEPAVVEGVPRKPGVLWPRSPT